MNSDVSTKPDLSTEPVRLPKKMSVASPIVLRLPEEHDQKMTLFFDKFMLKGDAKGAFGTHRVLAEHPDAAPRLLQQLGAAQLDMQGWDTNFVIRVADVNKALAKPGVAPAAFSATIEQGYTVTGTFDCWQVGRGGGGQNLHMNVPVKTGAVQFAGRKIDISNMTCVIEVKLNYLAAPTKKAPSGQMLDLVVKTVSTDPDSPAVSVLELRFAGRQPSPLDAALAQGAMAYWFNQHLQEFRAVFATVNLNAKAAVDDFKWVKPTFTSYAYYDGATYEESYFGVLNQVLGHSAEGLTNQLGAGAIPSGARAAFNISPEMLMEQLVLRACPSGTDGAKVTDFELISNGRVIQNANPVTLKKVNSGGVDYTPKAENKGDYRVTIVGDEIQVYVKLHIPVTPGIDAYAEITNFNKLQVVTATDGTQTLQFKQSRDPVQNHWVEKSTGIVVTEIILGILAALFAGVGGIVAKVVDGAVKTVIALIIIGVVIGLAAAIPTIIEAVAAGNMSVLPPIKLIVEDATTSVTWPGAAKFALKTGLLNGAFQLGGDPGFAS